MGERTNARRVEDPKPLARALQTSGKLLHSVQGVFVVRQKTELFFEFG